MLKKSFSNFLRFAVLFLIGVCLVYSVGYLVYNIYFSSFKLVSVIILVLFGLSIFYFKKYVNILKDKLLLVSHKKLILLIITLAFLVRILWVLLIPTVPASDFQLMYSTGEITAKGNYSAFHGFSYFARFAHDIVTVLYFSLFHKLTNNPLIFIKLANVFFQTAAVYGIYLTVKEALDEKSALLSAFFLAVCPPFIMFCSETMSENMAIPLYIFSVYIFLYVYKEGKSCLYLLISGMLLSFANMFRMVGIVFIAAYILFTFVYKGMKNGLINSSLLIISFIIPISLASHGLMDAKITETHLWESKEPSITSILKGTNIDSKGRFNKEDSELPIMLDHNPVEITEASKELIKTRLTTTPLPKLLAHYIQKLAAQWGMGDFKAVYWTIENSESNTITTIMKTLIFDICLVIQLLYVILLYRAFKLIKSGYYDEIESFNFFYILLSGFVLLFLVTELQERYAFIAAWLFIIFGGKYASVFKVFSGRSAEHSNNHNKL